MGRPRRWPRCAPRWWRCSGTRSRPRPRSECRAWTRSASATPAIPAPDAPGLQALLRTWIRAQRAPRESAASEALSVFVDRAKRCVRVGSREAELARRGSLWRIWERLVDAHLAGEPGITRDGLVEAGWPDESVLPESASARVHVALSTLRKLGLRDCFVRHGERYRIAPGVELRATD